MRYTDYHTIKIHKNALRVCSYDAAHDESMTTSELQVINFDAVKTDYMNHLNYSEEKARSVDVLANGLDHLTYLIEFKNGDVKREKWEIQLKIRDSILMLCDICHCNINKTRENVVFVLVYNEEKVKLDWETKRLMSMTSLSGKPLNFLDLDKADGFLVKRALMLNQDQFEKWILPKLCSM